MTNPAGWIGVDLDGTLVKYNGWKGIFHIGEPIRPMVDRVCQWLNEGHTVKIFTARVSDMRSAEEANQARAYIQDWCSKIFGVKLEVTNIKDFGMTQLWDDRAVQVVPNTGLTIEEFIKQGS